MGGFFFLAFPFSIQIVFCALCFSFFNHVFSTYFRILKKVLSKILSDKKSALWVVCKNKKLPGMSTGSFSIFFFSGQLFSHFACVCVCVLFVFHGRILSVVENTSRNGSRF